MSDLSSDLPNILGKVGWSAVGFSAAINMVSPPEECEPINMIIKHVFVLISHNSSGIIHHKTRIYMTLPVLETR